MSGATRELSLTLDSRLEHVALAGQALHGIAAAAGLPREACDGLELVLVEAVTNAVVHAYGGRPGHPIRVGVRLTDAQLEVSVHDSGRPMPPGTLERPEAEEPEDVLLMAEGGRGIPLMRRLTDGLSYASTPDGNTLTFTRHRPAAP